MPIIIGICGGIGSGKTSVSDYLKSKYEFYEYAFAEPLKKIATILHFEEKQLYGSQEDKLQINEHWGISAREFMQKFGTDICRDVLPQIIPDMKFDSIWVKLFEIYIEKIKKENKNVNIVISDVRFPNEAESIKKMGGFIFKLNRNYNKTHNHSSESYIDSIQHDVLIENNGTLEELHRKIFREICSLNIPICIKII